MKAKRSRRQLRRKLLSDWQKVIKNLCARHFQRLDLSKLVASHSGKKCFPITERQNARVLKQKARGVKTHHGRDVSPH